MLASRAVHKHTQDRTPSRAKQTSQGQRPGLGPLEKVPEVSPSLQRYLGNGYVQAMTTAGRETLLAPAVSPVVPAVPWRPSQGGILQRQCACGGAATMAGECEECSKQKRLGLQTKLTVNKPGDVYEREADRVADQVLATSAHTGVSGAPSHVQRFSGQLPGQVGAAPASVNQTLASPGRPLEPALRQDMEQRFGHDFSGVRVHTGAAAEQSAQDVNAHAYTTGHDIVFGAGRFTPGTQEGRRLLAHELTHVVQQSSGGLGHMIQRRLIVTGDKADIKTFLGLLEPASGFTLQHDPTTNEVSVTRSGGKPRSSELASRLRSIIDDPKQHAEINLGRTRQDVEFGAFPDNPEKVVQEIRIDQVLALEKGAPGSGVATLAHEIIENYEAHALKDYTWSVARAASHEKALKTENLIAGELGHPGSRRNTFAVDIDPGKGKPRFLRGIQDQEKYFLVWDKSLDSKGTVSNVRRVPRVKVSTYTIDGFTAGSTTLPKAGEATITTLAADLKKIPTASALVEGFATAGSPSAKDLELATKRAEMVRDKVIDKGADPLTIHWQRFHVVGSAARAGNSVVITVERPDIRIEETRS
jgi:outer membrane protein OmpA-like peptidoglycan-associated protein